MSSDVGVNCCREIGNVDLITENIIEEEIMETVVERKFTYNDYLKLIESEEKAIADLDNDIEAVESELEDVELSIDLAEAAKLNKIKSVYETLVATREDKEDRLEELERTLNERRGYLNSLREDDYVDSEDEVRSERDSLTSSMDTHIEKEYSSDVIEKDGVYSISSDRNEAESPYVIGTDGQVLF